MKTKNQWQAIMISLFTCPQYFLVVALTHIHSHLYTIKALVNKLA